MSAISASSAATRRRSRSVSTQPRGAIASGPTSLAIACRSLVTRPPTHLAAAQPGQHVGVPCNFRLDQQHLTAVSPGDAMSAAAERRIGRCGSGVAAGAGGLAFVRSVLSTRAGAGDCGSASGSTVSTAKDGCKPGAASICQPGNPADGCQPAHRTLAVMDRRQRPRKHRAARNCQSCCANGLGRCATPARCEPPPPPGPPRKR